MTMSNKALNDVIQGAYLPALSIIKIADTPEARVLLLAIGLHKTGLADDLGGPAQAGLWGFERDGAVRDVLTHKASAPRACDLCIKRGVEDFTSVWMALRHDEVLAAGLARLLLLAKFETELAATKPGEPRRLKALPSLGAEDEAWDCYVRTWWHSSAPSRQRWVDCYAEALAFVQSGGTGANTDE